MGEREVRERERGKESQRYVRMLGEREGEREKQRRGSERGREGDI